MDSKRFFIMGAPKCGTTSLAHWLSEHPEVFMCPRKEPHFFNFDMEYRSIHTLEEYDRLFVGGGEASVVGEASVYYLYSHRAASEIEKAYPGARYIVMLRKPTDLFFSLHSQQIFSANEDISDPGRAWELSSERKAKRSVPKLCRDPLILDYRGICEFDDQLCRLYRAVDSDRVYLCFMEEWVASPEIMYEEVLRFLGLSSRHGVSLERLNSAKQRRWPALKAGIKRMGALRRQLGLPNPTPVYRFLRWFDSLNRREQSKAIRPGELYSQITAELAPSIDRTEKITSRDLRTLGWYDGRPEAVGAK